MSWYCATWAINRKHGRGRECKWCYNNPDHRKGVSLRPIVCTSKVTANVQEMSKSAPATRTARSAKNRLDMLQAARTIFKKHWG